MLSNYIGNITKNIKKEQKEINYIKLKDVEIKVKIRNYKKMNNVKFSFNKEYLLISKPQYLSNSKLLKMILSIEDEIYSKYITSIEKNDKFGIANGNKILFKGNKMNIVINYTEDKKTYINIDNYNNVLYIYVNKDLDECKRVNVIREEIIKLFKDMTYSFVTDRIMYWSQIIGVKPNKVSIRYAKTRWGSCVKSTKSLNFNLLLITLPEEIADSVIVHEMCHLIEANHSKNFWNLVYKYIPKYKEYNVWIKENIKSLQI
jgi:predicted metal-dependent hydrolase